MLVHTESAYINFSKNMTTLTTQMSKSEASLVWRRIYRMDSRAQFWSDEKKTYLPGIVLKSSRSFVNTIFPVSNVFVQ